MRQIDVREIILAANRQRREFPLESLNELRESIERNGLLHPIVIRTSYDLENKGKTLIHLVAGERRLRAIQDLWALGSTFQHDEQNFAGPEVPCCSLSDLTPLAAEEAELEENIRREDLTWQERSAATARLKSLRDAQAQQAGLPEPSIASLSEEVRGSSEGKNQESTRRELIVSRYLNDPEVAAAKNVDEAFKVLKRKESTARNVALAASVGATFNSTMHSALNADALTWLKEAPPEQFDVILTDPPYGMGADEFGDSGGRTAGEHGYDDSLVVWKQTMSVFTEQCFRVAKPQAHAYIFCDIDQFPELRIYMAQWGWWVHRTPIIWHKPAAARIPWPEHGPQRKWEILLYAVKGKRPVTRIAPDLVAYAPDPNLGHQAQKPVNLFIDLLSRSVRPGDRVLDPFMGTGTIFPAAHELKCLATGIEQDASSYGIALKRLELLGAQKELIT